MSYPDSVRYLYAIGNELKGAKLGLDRIATLLDALGRPHQQGRFVHVAGTNGKGSTCAMIESGLRASGLRTGLFTSPHLVEPTERIRINGEPVSPEQFAAVFERVHQTAERMQAEGALDAHPSYFETVTAMAFLTFADQDVDIAVIEVGLGGRLDATNVITPELTVITPVDFDHQEFLGDTLEEIAGEKAGILKPGVPAVFAPQRPEAAGVLMSRASELGVPVTDVSRIGAEFPHVTARGCSLGVRGVRIDCPLAGMHQMRNARTAVVALQELGVPAEAIQKGIAGTVWPGRLEMVSEQPAILLDGAHNPAGVEALCAHLRVFYNMQRIWLVFGMMGDKPADQMLGPLAKLAHEVILTRPNSPRSREPEDLHKVVRRHARAELIPDVAAALTYAQHRASPEDLILITGSLYLVGEARALLVQ